MNLAPRTLSSLSHLSQLARLAVLFGALASVACGSATPAPEAPPPALDDPAPAAAADQSAKPSSKQVEEGIEAIKAQDFAKAKTLLSAAHRESPKDPQAAFYLGVALEGLGDATGAAAAYKDALALDPKLTEASVNLSALLLDQKDAAGALSAADVGLKTAPKQPDLLLNRALRWRLPARRKSRSKPMERRSQPHRTTSICASPTPSC